MKATLILTALIATSGLHAKGLNLNPSAFSQQIFDVSQLDKPATVKILLDQGVDTSLVELRGKHKVFNPANNTIIYQASSGKIAPLTHYIGGIRWNDDYPECFQMRIIPEDQDASFFYNGTQYHGTLEVYSIQGKLTFVTETDAEAFLKTMLTETFPEVKQKEVADAIAIVARTNLYYQISNSAQSFFHFTRDDIGYRGMINKGKNSRVDHAVDVTSQMVLTLDGSPFPTEWNENSAGRTSDFASIYRKTAKSPSGIESGFALRDRDDHKWTHSVELDTLAKKAELANIKSIDLFEDQMSQKVYAARINGSNDSKDLSLIELETILGKENIPSNDFHIIVNNGVATFNGYGKGHSVGLCLYSAHEMAKNGKSAIQILNTFYPETRLQKLRKSPPIR